jgi:predicted MPP superfamily phosphohydrolase
MDHQPIRLREAVDNRVTLQVSGHTHHGQLWPVSLITRAAYECDWGLFKKGNTHFYVSCGAGTWGPPVRTSCRPEVVMLELHFGKIGEVSHVNQFGDTKR